jgi:translation initiation factor eIF-2B subunit alpha
VGDSKRLQSFSDLKTELVKQGQNYAAEALTYRQKIAELSLGFIKDDSVVRLQPYSTG